MSKRILALILAAVMISLVATGCKEPEPETGKKEPNKSSSTVSTESLPYDWQLETTSCFFRDTDEAKNSSTSQGVKEYKYEKTLMIGAYGANPSNCTFYGVDKASRLREFKELIDSGYFNTYLIGGVSSEYFLDALKLVAEAGHSAWVAYDRFTASSTYTIEQWIKDFDVHIEQVRKAGLMGAIAGFYWDEPIWTGQKNDDFLAQSKAIYTTYGWRTNPVFATGEFTNYEGNADALGTTADQMKKLETYAAKYLTDISYDAYGVDPGDGIVYREATVKEWQKNLGADVTNGQQYFLALKKLLKKRVGHDANYWYYPCAYAAPRRDPKSGTIGKADESHWINHLKFMAEDVLKEEYGGGLLLYTYGSSGGESTGLNVRLVFTDASGNQTLYPEHDKYKEYSKLLKEYTAKFSSTKNKLVDLGL